MYKLIVLNLLNLPILIFKNEHKKAYSKYYNLTQSFLRMYCSGFCI